LLKLIRFRNEYEAFNGEFMVQDCQKDEIRLTWKKDDKRCSLFIDLKTYKTTIDYINENGEEVKYLV
jgi:hypothetical protein